MKYSYRTGALKKANILVNDEYYTRYKDIENEVQYHREHFKGKTVYLNCDSPASNFFHYFVENFRELKLKKVIATHYIDQEPNMFDPPEEKPVKAEYDGQRLAYSELKGDGDFRSYESRQILEESDIVVTNPPFSLVKDFVPQMMKYEKKFLVIARMYMMAYRTILPYYTNGDIWLGRNRDTMSFLTNDGSPLKLGGIVWITNIGDPVYENKFDLTKKYYGNEKDYIEYDFINAIYVDKVENIPVDYPGYMSVSLNYILNHEPSEFKIYACTRGNDFLQNIPGLFKRDHLRTQHFVNLLNGKNCFARFLIRNRKFVE